MVIITYRKKKVAVTQLWFAGDMAAGQQVKTDILFFHGMPFKAADRDCLSTEFHTLISNLSESEETLFSKINKNVRYEIRRNCKETAEYKTFTSKELAEQPEVTEQFADMYELMYREKGVKAAFNMTQFKAYMKEEAIMLTAIYEGGRPLVFHSYIVGEDQVRLLHSVSDFRSGEVDANLVARANKRLHWEDMLLFQKEGRRSYDWGGVSSLEKPNGIDAFKFKFGGEPLTYYNVYKGKSWLGKMAVFVMKKRMGKK